METSSCEAEDQKGHLTGQKAIIIIITIVVVVVVVVNFITEGEPMVSLDSGNEDGLTAINAGTQVEIFE